MSKDRSLGGLARIVRMTVLLVLFASVCAAGYGFYAIGLPAWQNMQSDLQELRLQVQQNEAGFADQISNLERSVTDQLAEVNGVDRASLTRLKLNLEAMVDDQEVQQRARQTRLLQKIQSLEVQIDRLSGSDPSRWILAEAEFNLRLANRQLVVMGDTATAIEILRTIRTNLGQLDPLLVEDTYFAIEQDIAMLEAYTAPDRYALLARLSQLSDDIARLKFGVTVPTADAAAVSDTRSADATSADLLDPLMAFSQFFVVTRVDPDSALPLTQERQKIERQLLDLRLEQLISAAMSEDAGLYGLALSRFEQNLRNLRAYDPSAIDAMLTTLQSLESTHTVTEIPDLSRTEQAIRRFKQQLDTRGVQP